MSTLLAFASALPILADVLGIAVYGVNLAVAIYLLLTISGVLGLLTGFAAVLRPTRVLLWITSASGFAIAGVAIIFACGFILGRNREVPFNSAMYIAGIHAPVLAFYGAATIFCLAEAFIYWAKIRSSATKV